MSILIVDTSFSFLLSKTPLEETSTSSPYLLLDKVSLLDIESSDDLSVTKIFLSKEITGVNLSYSYSKEFFYEVSRDSSRFELILSSYNS